MTIFAPNGSAPWAELAGRLLIAGGLVAIPTETVYGLAASVFNRDALRRVFSVKGRPMDNPLIAHIASAEQMDTLTRDVPEAAWQLASAFWPGPLTLVLPRAACVPDEVTAGLSTVAVRCPAHDVARRVILAAGVPLAAPSANRSGRPSPTRAAHVLAELYGDIEMIIDGGVCSCGIESTVFDVENRCILRPGGVTKKSIESVLGSVEVAPNLPQTGAPRAPGMKYRHYAPRAPLHIVRGPAERMAEFVSAQSEPEHIGVLCFDDERSLFRAGVVRAYGPEDDPEALARTLFDALLALDETDVTVIYARCPDGDGLAEAVANRLYKAAGYSEIHI